jgi:hypothetical protein
MQGAVNTFRTIVRLCFLNGPCKLVIKKSFKAGRSSSRKKEKKNKSLDIEQICGHGSQRGSMPGVAVLAGCRQ